MPVAVGIHEPGWGNWPGFLYLAWCVGLLLATSAGQEASPRAYCARGTLGDPPIDWQVSDDPSDCRRSITSLWISLERDVTCADIPGHSPGSTGVRGAEEGLRVTGSGQNDNGGAGSGTISSSWSAGHGGEMSIVSITRMHADEIDTDMSLMRRPLSGQFPGWAELPIEPVRPMGTVNAMYRLGDDLVVRLPRVHRAIGGQNRELDWLPHLASQLPMATPRSSIPRR